MKKSFYSLIILSFILLAFTVNCNSSGGGGDTEEAASTAITNLGTLVKANAPVETITAASISALETEADLAETGLVFAEANASSFNSQSALGFCSATQMMKSMVFRVAEPDMILCHLAASLENNSEVQAALEVAGRDDFYDGIDTIVKVTFSDEMLKDDEKGKAPGEGPGMLMKFNIEKNADGVIEKFTLKGCNANGVQKEFIQQINGAQVESTIKFKGGDEDFSFGEQTTVKGKVALNAEGESVFDGSKIMKSLFYHGYDGGSGFGSVDAIVYPDYVKILSTDVGTYTWTDGTYTESGSYKDEIVSFMQLIDQDDLGLMAGGSGTTMGIYEGTYGPDSTTYSDEFELSWDGDTTLPLDDPEDGYFYALANAETIPEAPSAAPAISFEGDEAWDCDDTNAFEITIGGDETEKTAMMACVDKHEMDFEYMNCWDIIENGNNGDGGGDGTCSGPDNLDMECGGGPGGAFTPVACSPNNECLFECAVAADCEPFGSDGGPNFACLILEGGVQACLPENDGGGDKKGGCKTLNDCPDPSKSPGGLTASSCMIGPEGDGICVFGCADQSDCDDAFVGGNMVCETRNKILGCFPPNPKK